MLSVVIPVFNEAESLEQLHEELIEVAKAQGYRLDVVFVDETELPEPLRRDAHGLGRQLFLVGALPEDRGAALRRDHRVRGVLQHQHTVGDADRQLTGPSAQTSQSEAAGGIVLS